MTDIDVFDGMVDELLAGENLVTEFDSGITLIVNDDMVSISYADNDELLELNLDGDEIEYLHLFLEARFVSRSLGKDINWTKLITGNS